MDLVDHLVHALLELVERHEAIDGEGQEELRAAAPVALVAKHPAEPPARQHSGQHVEHHGHAIPLRAAERVQGAAAGGDRVGGGVALGVAGPAERDRLALRAGPRPNATSCVAAAVEYQREPAVMTRVRLIAQ